MTAIAITADQIENTIEQIDRANATGLTPVVFMQGLWLRPSGWHRRAAVFEQAGYMALTPGCGGPCRTSQARR